MPHRKSKTKSKTKRYISKKKNGHKDDCKCPICINMKFAKRGGYGLKEYDDYEKEVNNADNGMPDNGMPDNGMPDNGMPDNGMPDNGMPDNGMPDNGMPDNGMPDNIEIAEDDDEEYDMLGGKRYKHRKSHKRRKSKKRTLRKRR